MAVLAAVSRLKALGTKIVILYSDNLASRSCPRGRFYRDLLTFVDHIVVPCNAMKNLLAPYADPMTPITIIDDPWQVCQQSYNALLPGEPLRIVWFGNTTNIIYFQQQIASLMQKVSNADLIELSVLSSPQALDAAKVAFRKALPSALKKWSLNLMVWHDKRQPCQLEEVLGSSPSHGSHQIQIISKKLVLVITVSSMQSIWLYTNCQQNAEIT